MSYAAQTQSTSNYNTSGKAIVMRPKGKGQNSRRDIYDTDSRKYMKDLRAPHEQSNTLLAMIGADKLDKQFKPSSWTTVKSRNPKKQEKQENKEMFPVIGKPVKTKSNSWVKPFVSNDAFIDTPSSVSKKVENKPKMQVLSKETMNNAVDNLNFQEEKEKLLADIERWQQVAEERAHMLDEMEWEINRLRRELDDAYDRCN